MIGCEVDQRCNCAQLSNLLTAAIPVVSFEFLRWYKSSEWKFSFCQSCWKFIIKVLVYIIIILLYVLLNFLMILFWKYRFKCQIYHSYKCESYTEQKKNLCLSFLLDSWMTKIPHWTLVKQDNVSTQTYGLWLGWYYAHLTSQKVMFMHQKLNEKDIVIFFEDTSLT